MLARSKSTINRNGAVACNGGAKLHENPYKRDTPRWRQWRSQFLRMKEQKSKTVPDDGAEAFKKGWTRESNPFSWRTIGHKNWNAQWDQAKAETYGAGEFAEKIRDERCHDHDQPNEEVWLTQDGRTIKVGEMHEDHCRNALRMLIRQKREKKLLTRHEAYIWVADQLREAVIPKPKLRLPAEDVQW